MSATMQRSEALDRARAIKRERLRLLGGGYGRKLPVGEIAALILECPDALASMEILDLLGYAQSYRSRRSYSDQILKAERLLFAEGIRTNRRLGELSDRQRQAVADRLRGGR